MTKIITVSDLADVFRFQPEVPPDHVIVARSAYHEVSHAVLATAAGIPVKGIYLFGSPYWPSGLPFGVKGLCEVDEEYDQHSELESAAYYMAGLIGSDLFSGHPVSLATANEERRYDLKYMTDQCPLISESEACDEAKRVLLKNSSIVQYMALELIEHKHILQERFEREYRHKISK